jgi:hypothetical protein
MRHETKTFTIMNQVEKIRFRTYITKAGYYATRIWENQEGYYAQLLGHTSSPNKFTQILQGGTVVRLSKADTQNPLIVGENIQVIFG